MSNIYVSQYTRSRKQKGGKLDHCLYVGIGMSLPIQVTGNEGGCFSQFPRPLIAIK